MNDPRHEIFSKIMLQIVPAGTANLLPDDNGSFRNYYGHSENGYGIADYLVLIKTRHELQGYFLNNN